MFSMTTIASSTTKPVAIVSAISVRLLIEKPARYMTPNVPTSDNGTATLGMSVAGTLRRKTKITITTSATASKSSNSTSCTDERIVTVRSVRSSTSTAAGSEALRRGSNSLTLSTTSMTLVPGCRWMLRMIAGVLFAHAASREFSAPSTASAMSDTRTGAPFLYAMMSCWYSSEDLSWSLASIVDARVGPSKLPFA